MAEADPGKTFSIDDTTPDFADAIERTHAGDVIVLTKDGMPYAQLAPYGMPPAEAGDGTVGDRPRRQPGGLAGQLAGIPDSVWFDPLPEDELAAWEGRYSNIL